MDKDKTIHEVASYICEKYDILLATFNEITAYGKEYFEQKRFHEHHAQQQNRYRLYGNYVKDVYAKTQSCPYLSQLPSCQGIFFHQYLGTLYRACLRHIDLLLGTGRN